MGNQHSKSALQVNIRADISDQYPKSILQINIPDNHAAPGFPAVSPHQCS